jgi:tetratricopeptide (TPR) repeat protein
VKIQALDEQQLANPDALVKLDFHRRVAAKLLKDGAPDRAFIELMRGAQDLPLDDAYAGDLVRAARRARMEDAAVAALEAAILRASLGRRNDLRRRLARLFRRVGKVSQARDQLLAALGDDAQDARARLMLVAAALQESNWALAAEQLGIRVDEHARGGRHRSAARDALCRARLLAEKLGDPLAGAGAYQHASELARKGGDSDAVFSARALAARALVAGKAPADKIDAALRDLNEAGRETRRQPEASAIAAELGKSAGVGQAKTLALLGEAALARGAFTEASALLKAAVEADPADAALAARLEAFFIGRGAWEDLAQMYRGRATREKSPPARSDLLHRLAELLEDELADRTGAAEVYAEIVALTGDPAALSAQVRLLSASTDPAAVQGALDAAVKAAQEPRARAEALTLRGEVHLNARRIDRAGADFLAATELAPDHLRALAGLAECKADRPVIERLAQAVRTLPRGASNRVTLLRRLARLLEWPLGEEPRARDAWSEVLAESPADVEAEGHLIDLTRRGGDREALAKLLRRRLAREPRGVQARQARHELAQSLESMGRDEEALEEWRMAARMEPGDAVALVALADRCESRGRLSEAAFAIEGAAAATERGPERAALWRRLARLSRERLDDPARAAVCDERARQLEAEGQGSASPPGRRPAKDLPPPPPMPMPAAPAPPVLLPAAGSRRERKASKPTIDLRKLPSSPPSKPAAPTKTPPEPTTDGEAPVGEPEQEIKTGDILAIISGEEHTPVSPIPAVGSPERDSGQTPVSGPPPPPAPKGAKGPGRRGFLSGELEERPASFAREARPRRDTGEQRKKAAAVRKRTSDEPKLRARVDEDPFDVGGYEALAEIYERARDAERASLMDEIGRALEGDPFAEPLSPRYTLNSTDWTSLRHPELRGAAGELFAIVGPAFCSLDAVPARQAGVRRGFAMEESAGARATGEALLAAVRVLGMRSPDVGVGAIDSPPLRAVNTDPPQLLVGRSAIQKRLPAAQLRFFAGRALATFKPEMMALRLMPSDRVDQCMDALKQIMDEVRPLSQDARQLARRVSEKAEDRIGQLLSTLGRRGLTVDDLNEGARHTSNRAGLLVAGGVAPALAALRAKRDSEDEVAEMLRFAASDRYLSFRQRRSSR